MEPTYVENAVSRLRGEVEQNWLHDRAARVFILADDLYDYLEAFLLNCEAIGILDPRGLVSTLSERARTADEAVSQDEAMDLIAQLGGNRDHPAAGAVAEVAAALGHQPIAQEDVARRKIAEKDASLEQRDRQMAAPVPTMVLPPSHSVTENPSTPPPEAPREAAAPPIPSEPQPEPE